MVVILIVVVVVAVVVVVVVIGPVSMYTKDRILSPEEDFGKKSKCRAKF